MANKRKIISMAFGRIGLSTYTWTPTPQQRADALASLESIAARWESIGLRVGYRLGGTEDSESGIPDTREDVFYNYLAMAIAPMYGKTASMELKQAASDGYSAMATSLARIPQVQMPNTMPVGRGNMIIESENKFFSEKDPLTTGNDGELTL
jgi:P22 tail accessory factor